MKQVYEDPQSTISKKKSTKHMTALFWLIIFVLTLICSAINKNPDNDMWWMMATGREILNTKAVPTINPFVVHEDFNIIVQQWCLAIVNYLVYSNLGRIGLIVFALFALMVNIFLLNKYIAYFTSDRIENRILLFISVIICSFYLNTRPTQFTIMVLLLEQIVVLKYKKTKEKKWLWLLPVLSIIEINLHSSLWPFIFVMLLPHIVPDMFINRENILRQINEKKDYIFPVLLSLVVGILNPNGINSMLYLFKSYNSSKVFHTIYEIQSPSAWSMHGIFLCVSVIAFSVYMQRICDKEFDISGVYMGLGVIILAAKHCRNVWFLIFLIIPTGKYLIRRICEVIAEYGKNNKNKPFPQVIKRGVLSAVYIFTVCTMVLSIVCIFDDSNDNLPEEAAKYLERVNKDEVRLCTTFNTGGYFEWKGYKVYIDARPELFVEAINGKEDIAEEYYSLENGTIDYGAFLNKYNFTHIITCNDTCFNTFLKYSSDYRLVSDDGYFMLYEK